MSYIFFNSEYNNIAGAIFILAIILLVIAFRKNFKREGPAFIYRTKIGINLINKIGSHTKFVKIFGYIGIIVGILAAIFGLYNILIYYYNISLFKSLHVSAVELALPFYIPGVSIGVPIIYWIIAILVTVLPHEFSHGIVARAHKLKIKSTGFGFAFAFIPLAFVELDEKKMYKSKLSTQLSVLSAGSFSNIIIGALALFFYIIIAFFLVSNNLVSFSNVYLNLSSIKNSPAYQAGIPYNHTIQIVKLDNKSISFNAIELPLFGFVIPQIKNNQYVYSLGPLSSYSKFNSSSISLLQVYSLLEKGNSSQIFQSFNKSYYVVPSNFTVNKTIIHYGVKFITYFSKQQPFTLIPIISANAFPTSSTVSQILFWLEGLLLWIFIFGIGVGVINMLPIFFITDGSNALFSILKSLLKNEKNAMRITYAINAILTFVLIFSIAFVI
ncbi:MAG: site-2 protease family protein [Candidatus Rehaiarchaeum fermentans]|nr:site-2 protease family protein [Candidatus Rehaiarchaeum fermentans]MCW1297326.1 site-2 protease family protein [Candidatus Rehaiarchaeum fermentans]MCW1302349.1 site-2 protease family protein [Candidatus Rehaiarchaeum fermentans]